MPARSSSITSEYLASLSACSSTQSSSLPCDFRCDRVISSLGNIDVVAPSSAPIFVIVALSAVSRSSTPMPPYSIIFPTPPFTVSLFRMVKITSIAVTHGLCSLPVSLTSITSGIIISSGAPAITVAASNPPTPIAIMPTPPPVGVWLSVPMAIFPGAENLSK